MKKHLLFLAGAIVLGGLATVSLHNDHSPTISSEIKKEVSKQFDAPSYNFVAVAQVDYTPVSVIRPGTRVLIIDHGNTVLPKIVSPVLPVAHGPPKI